MLDIFLPFEHINLIIPILISDGKLMINSWGNIPEVGQKVSRVLKREYEKNKASYDKLIFAVRFPRERKQTISFSHPSMMFSGGKRSLYEDACVILAPELSKATSGILNLENEFKKNSVYQNSPK